MTKLMFHEKLMTRLYFSVSKCSHICSGYWWYAFKRHVGIWCGHNWLLDDSPNYQPKTKQLQKKMNNLTKNFGIMMITSDMEMVDPLIDDNVVLYLVGIDWVVSKGDKGRSKSRSGGMFGASMLFCRLWDCCKRYF